jgi:hypothetical protein
MSQRKAAVPQLKLLSTRWQEARWAGGEDFASPQSGGDRVATAPGGHLAAAPGDRPVSEALGCRIRRVGRALGADRLDRRGTRPGGPTLVASPRRVALRATQRGRPRSVADSACRDSSMVNRGASTGWAGPSTPTTRPLVGTARCAPSSATAARQGEHVGDTNLELDVQASGAAITEVAEGYERPARRCTRHG